METSKYKRRLVWPMPILLLVLNSLSLKCATAALITLPAAKPITHAVYTHKSSLPSLGQLVTSSTLVWQNYDADDSKQFEFAVQGGVFVTGEEHYPIYVCRVRIDGVYISGYTKKIQQAYVCIPAYFKHNTYDEFDILVNKGKLGNVAWKIWSKHGNLPIGAISINKNSFIARHRASTHQENDENGTFMPGTKSGSNYNFGCLEPDFGISKIRIMENKTEKFYEEGEVLVETEPVRYELRDIVLKRYSIEESDNWTDLASTTLFNSGDKYSLIETTLSQEVEEVQFWGTQDGAARGLPTTVYEHGSTPSAQIDWGLKYKKKTAAVQNANAMLHPGTATNVTLMVNYATINAIYTANFHSFYAGSSGDKKRKISGEMSKSYVKDVKVMFSPIYWAENGTVIPTTTSSTTTTTTHATITSTKDPVPMLDPPIMQENDLDQDAMVPISNSNSIEHNMAENLAEKHQKPAVAGVGVSNNGVEKVAKSYSSLIAGLTILVFSSLA